jgi:hypothetical protein
MTDRRFRDGRPGVVPSGRPPVIFPSGLAPVAAPSPALALIHLAAGR